MASVIPFEKGACIPDHTYFYRDIADNDVGGDGHIYAFALE